MVSDDRTVSVRCPHATQQACGAATGSQTHLTTPADHRDASLTPDIKLQVWQYTRFGTFALLRGCARLHSHTEDACMLQPLPQRCGTERR